MRTFLPSIGSGYCSSLRRNPSRASSKDAPDWKARKRALLIAINYSNIPEPYRLRGPQQEVVDVRNLLITQYQYLPEDITVLTDKEGVSKTHYPSKENILNALRHFYDNQEPGDQYLFYFAGHSFLNEVDKYEEDYFDAYILPSVDPASETFERLATASLQGRGLREIVHRSTDFFDVKSAIPDDVLEQFLVRPLHTTSRLTIYLIFGVIDSMAGKVVASQEGSLLFTTLNTVLCSP
ncbi:hypothetical protein C0995_013725 [Termitomyces sp. Mi166|nr:hypothetical protein C0995_013725 [Termitomyces sp. Mi166\